MASPAVPRPSSCWPSSGGGGRRDPGGGTVVVEEDEAVDTLKRGDDQRPHVRVTVSVAGGDVHELSVEDATYGDLLETVGFSAQEATVLVDGQPVPADRPVDAERVEVLRLIKGG